jgi:exonuclease SbcC
VFLRKIRLYNFRQFVDAEIDFTDGITAIVGPNGSGKTTVIEAISWALYGENRATKETIAHIWGDNKAEVSLEFSVGRREYRVERSLDSAKLWELAAEEDKLMSTGLTAVTSQCEILLNLTYDQFRSSFCAEQRQLEFLKFSSAEKKQDHVAKMLGFDNLRTAAKLEKDRATAALAEWKGMKNALGEPGPIREEFRRCVAEAKDAKLNLGRSRGLLKELTDEREKFTLRKDAADEALALIKRMAERRQIGADRKREMENETAQVAKHEKECAELKRLQPAAAEYSEKKPKVDEMQRAAEARTKAEWLLAQLKAKIEECEKKCAAMPTIDIDKLERTSIEMAKVLADAERLVEKEKQLWIESVSNARTAVALAESKADQLNSELSRAREMERDGKCATCGQSLPPQRISLGAKLEKDLEKAGSEVSSAKKKLSALSSAPLPLSKASQAADEAKGASESADKNLRDGRVAHERRMEEMASLKNAQEQLADLEVELKRMPGFDRETVEKAKAELAALQEPWERSMRLAHAPEYLSAAKKRFDVARARFEEAKAEQGADEARVKKLGHTKETAQELIEAFERLQKEIRNAEINAASQTQIAAATIERMRVARDRIRSDRRSRAAAIELHGKYILHAEVAKGLTELRDRLNAQTIPRLQLAASDSLAQLTGGRYLGLKLNDRFEATIMDGNTQKKVISGGEEDMVHLALRLGLAQMIQDASGQPMSLLILDEAFGSLDTDRRDNLMERLDALSGIFRQIIVISHVETIKEAADQCVFLKYDPLARCTVVEDPPCLAAIPS